MNELKSIIDRSYDKEVDENISDENLHEKYMEQKSVKKRMNDVRNKLYGVIGDDDLLDNVINIITGYIIPAGTKGVVRGLCFNQIVSNVIQTSFSAPNFIVCFEKYCQEVKTPEKPDWWIHNKENNRYVVGFNQIDLWSGGAQTNRANKYLSDVFHNSIPDNSKILCVICSEISFKRKTDKTNLFFQAFKKDRLCYTKTLVDTINKLLKK